MNTPSPTALVIATIIEGALAPIFATLAAPLLARIDELEKRDARTFDEAAFDAAVMTAIRNQPGAVVDFLAEEIDKRAPTDEFIEKVTNSVFTSPNFDIAVLGVIEDNSKDVIENLGDDLTDKITNAESISDSVAEVLRRGSFSVEFSKS